MKNCNHSAKLSQSIGVVISDILADSTANSDSLLHYVQKLPTPHAAYNVVDILVEKGEYAAAQAYLATLPTQFPYIARQSEEYNNIVNFINLTINIRQADRNWQSMTETELTDLQAIAQGEGIGSIKAQSVLCFLYGDCPDTDISINQPSLRTLAPLPHNISTISTECLVSPNPAKEYVNFEYVLPQQITQAKLSIRDVAGKVIAEIQITQNQGIQLYDTKDMANGMYFYEISTQTEKIASGKFSVNK